MTEGIKTGAAASIADQNSPLLAQLGALKTASPPELKRRWRELFGSEPPPYNRRFLESRLGYRIQELAYGGLKPQTVARLEALGERLDGGNAALRDAFPGLEILAGAADIPLIESAETILRDRYGWYDEYGIGYPDDVKRWLRDKGDGIRAEDIEGTIRVSGGLKAAQWRRCASPSVRQR